MWPWFMFASVLITVLLIGGIVFVEERRRRRDRLREQLQQARIFANGSGDS